MSNRNVEHQARSTKHSTISAELILLLDQVPRNIYRNTAQAFASDATALEFARKAVSSGFDGDAGKDERLSYYLPFEHTEDCATQDEAAWLILPLVAPAELEA